MTQQQEWLAALGNNDPHTRPHFIWTFHGVQVHTQAADYTLLTVGGMALPDIPVIKECARRGVSWSIRAIDSHLMQHEAIIIPTPPKAGYVVSQEAAQMMHKLLDRIAGQVYNTQTIENDIETFRKLLPGQPTR